MSDALVLLNATRAMHDVRRLKRGWLLGVYAQRHSRKMAREHTLAHGDLQGFLVSRHAWHFWGENVGATSSAQPDPVLELHKALLASPDHRRNILDPRFRRVGIGLYSKGGVTWLTQAFRA